MTQTEQSRLHISGRPLLALLSLVAALLLVLAIRNTAPPAINLTAGGTSVTLSADRAWTLAPGDCVTIRWQLEGIESLYIAGEGVIGWGETPFCPAINASELLIEVTAQNGLYRALSLRIHHLPDLLFYLFGFVGLLGSILLGFYFLIAHKVSSPPPISWLAVGALLLALIGSWQRLQPVSAPVIDEDQGELALRFWAENDRIIFPHECVAVGWSVVGSRSIRFNGAEVSDKGNPAGGRHCAEDGATARLELVDREGASLAYSLPIPPSFPNLSGAPAFIYLSLIGILLGLILYIPIIWQLLREHWGKRSRADQVALVSCFGFVLLLYLPFGFDSAAHWEEWIIHGYTEGGGLSFYREETVSRFFVTIPHTLAYLISSDSFIGYHLVNFSLYTLEMILLYGILRQLGVAPLYAFLMTILFLVYPVNSALMTTRRLPKNFSVMTLLLATFLMLDYCRRPRRSRLLGVWLALMYSVNTNETGFAVILFVPLLWWLRERGATWRNLNLTAIWYLAPAFKIGYFILLLLTKRDFYQSGLLQSQAEAGTATLSAAEIFTQVMSQVFRQTFFEGWRGALATLEQNSHWLSIALMLALVAAAALYLARSVDAAFPRQSWHTLLGGLLVIGASVGILMWFPLYRNDPWRMYLVVPVGAAVALVSLLMLGAARIRRARYRSYTLIALSLLLLIPAASRLILQLDHFSGSAQAKAQILRQIVTLAPALEAGTQVAIVTDMSHAALHEQGIFELLHNDMVNSALHVLYQDAGPEVAYFCVQGNPCGEFSGDETVFSAAKPGELLARTLVFRLNEDLTVELVEDPAPLLELGIDIPYAASRLYAADAPRPPRLESMLGAAGR